MAFSPFPIDFDRRVDDDVVFATVPGAEEYLVSDAQAMPRLDHVQLVGSGKVAAHLEGPTRRLGSLRTSGAISIALGSAYELISRLKRSAETGVASAIGRRPLRFRVGPMPDRFELRDRIVAELGWMNDPSCWDLNLEDQAGTLRAEVGALHRPRRVPFGHLRRLPTSTNPVVAAILVRIAGVGPGQVVRDLCCGAGTILVEVLAAHLDTQAIGSDISAGAVEVAGGNLAVFDRGRWSVARADANSSVGRSEVVDCVITNLPFGKRIGSHRSNIRLYPSILRQIDACLSPKGRAVLLTEDKRIFETSIRQVRGLRVAERRVLTVGGLHPTAYLLERTD